MAGLIGQPDLAPPIRTYRAYFSRPETDLFSGDYTAVLESYRVNPPQRRRRANACQRGSAYLRREPAG